MSPYQTSRFLWPRIAGVQMIQPQAESIFIKQRFIISARR